MQGTGAGVYVHIPFCAKRCDYCAFATWTDRHHLRSAYVDACISQVRIDQQEAGLATSIYVGGGTPSQLESRDLARLLGAIESSPGAEITVEANPDDVDDAWAEQAASAGVTRISLGLQSFDDAVLAGLGRSHRGHGIELAVGALSRAGLTDYSVDLIYGGKGETDKSWTTTLERALGLDPAPRHISAYALTVEAGTPLQRAPERHPDDDVLADRYEIADALLHTAGLCWYEISNWAVAGHECRHNMNYWDQGDYLAIGAAAHGHRRGTRWWNLRTPERYIEAVAAARSPIAVREVLDPATVEREGLELALRTSRGVPSAALDRHDPDLDGLVDWRAEGRGQDEGRAVLTLRGRLLANEVAIRLCDPVDHALMPSYHLKGQETTYTAAMPEPICWMSTVEAADYLGVNTRTLYRMIDEGGLPAYKFGRVIRLQESDVVAFVEQARIQPGSLEHLYPMPVRSDS